MTVAPALRKQPRACHRGTSSMKDNTSTQPSRSTYHNMLRRCLNPEAKDYSYYGGRGITVCDRWQGQGGFRRFAADMGEKPTPGHSLDRIDNDGPYSPENCRWATWHEQHVNSSRPAVLAKRHGPGNPGVILEEIDVVYALMCWTRGDMEREIYTRLGVSRGCVNNIVRGATWTKVDRTGFAKGAKPDPLAHAKGNTFYEGCRTI